MSSIPEPGLAPGLPGTSRAARYGLGSLAAIALLFLGLPVAALLARGLFGGALRDAPAEALRRHTRHARAWIRDTRPAKRVRQPSRSDFIECGWQPHVGHMVLSVGRSL